MYLRYHLYRIYLNLRLHLKYQMNQMNQMNLSYLKCLKYLMFYFGRMLRHYLMILKNLNYH